MGRLEHTRELVAGVVDRLDLDGNSARLNDDVWRITRGSAIGSVRLLPHIEDEEQSLIMVTMSVLSVPPQHSLMAYRKLLELNYLIRGRAAFALTDDVKIVLLASRPIHDLDESELVDLIAETSALADEYDDRLAEYFTAR